MKFCIVIIAKNESANIHKLAESAKDYMNVGGKIYLYDTGSTDDTVEVAKKLGFVTKNSTTNFHKTLTKKHINSWKTKYKMGCTPLAAPITFFCFDLARNSASEFPEEDIIFFADGCDYFLNLDYDHVNKLIEEGHDTFTIIQNYGGQKGRINRFYNRKKGKWLGHVHEYVECGSNFYWLPESVFSIEHKFVEKDRADKYLAGLIFTHLTHPDDDKGRWHYYVARELMYRGYFVDARRLFQKRVDKLYFPEERAAALCFSAKCCNSEGGTAEEIESYYEKAYDIKSSLCEPLFEICEYNFKKQNWSKVLKIANECLELVKSHNSIFFEQDRFTKKENLYWYLYHGHWWAGTKDMALYYWRSYSKSRGIIDEKHEYWKFLSKYKYFPDVPYMITEFKQTSDTEEVYKCITTIEDTCQQFSKEDDTIVKLIRKFLPPNTCVVDVCAGKGFTSIPISKAIYPSMLHSFEISKFKELNSNVFINLRKNVKTYEIALSNEKGSFSVFVDEDIENLIHVDTLDILCISEVGLIKFETQHENYSILNMVKGSICTLTKCKPVIAIITRVLSNEFDETDIDTLLIPLNYTKMRLKNSIFYLPGTCGVKKKKVAIVCYTPTNHTIKWDGNIKNKYIEFGESEQAVINLAKSLEMKDMIVDVWGNPTQKFSFGTNPRYLDYKNFHSFIEESGYYDSVIYWRYANEIKNRPPGTKNILWLHDYVYPDVDENLVDSVVFLSENHKNEVMKKINNKEYIEKISRIIPNGIDVNLRYQQKIPLKCVYLNNHAYGLESLLDGWKKIKGKFPLASLHILHGSQTWGIKTHECEENLKNKILKMSDKSIVLHQTLNQANLQRELETSDFWLYPCIYEEPFCVQGVQAAYSGVIPIVSDQVFLKKLTHESCVVWPLENDNFTEKCIEIMSLDKEKLDLIRREVISRGKSLFCDLQKFSEMFMDIIC